MRIKSGERLQRTSSSTSVAAASGRQTREKLPRTSQGAPVRGGTSQGHQEIRSVVILGTKSWTWHKSLMVFKGYAVSGSSMFCSPPLFSPTRPDRFQVFQFAKTIPLNSLPLIRQLILHSLSWPKFTIQLKVLSIKAISKETSMTKDNTEVHLKKFMRGLKRRNPGEKEFHQAVHEVAESIIPFLSDHRKYDEANILERMTEPDRIIIFRVCWEDDKGNIRTNRGYRVQFNNAIGPYKGGLRFHPTVSLSILKFLGFEQTFKNSLTTLPMGGAKGGSDFNPKGKTSREIMRFCQAFMTELSQHIGKDTDVPAGDIGVGSKEISYMFGQHKRLTNKFTGVLTGKGLAFGGSLIRNEATGYGCVYFVENMLNHIGDSIKGKTCVVSGSGNVAQYTTEKVIQLGGKVVTLSDSSGYVYDPDGINAEKLAWVLELKNVRRGRIKEYAENFGVEYFEGEKPWKIPCDAAFPSATQNEISVEDAKVLVKNGCRVIGEGANMPTETEGIEVFQASQLLYAPSKAANAGGVAVSGLEMTQNSLRLSWTREELDQRLREIMQKIHAQCVQWGQEGSHVNYQKGANIAGFVKVADAMLAYGVV